MFFTLLIVTFLIALAVSFGVVRLFDRPIASILQRVVAEELSGAWHRYIKFAAYVVGVSGGVRIHELERYISAPDPTRTTVIEILDASTPSGGRSRSIGPSSRRCRGLPGCCSWSSWWRSWRTCSRAASS